MVWCIKGEFSCLDGLCSCDDSKVLCLICEDSIVLCGISDFDVMVFVLLFLYLTWSVKSVGVYSKFVQIESYI